MGWKCFIERADFMRDWRIAIGRPRDDGSIEVMSPPDMVTVTERVPMVETLRLPAHDAKAFLQAIVDAAWDEGIRPSDWSRRCDAQEKHLADMRKLVGKTAGVDLA